MDPVNTVDTMAMAREERGELVDLLVTLTPEQWEAPTLCSEWCVREVVAHMFSYEELGRLQLVGRFLRRGPGRANDLGVAAYADRSPDELIALAKNHLQPTGLTAAFGGRIALTDGTIHHQDIRRPLGLPRRIPPERLLVVLDYARTAPPIRARTRIRGLTLRATDLDWTTGSGPEVTGPAEALLMALAGRPGITGELSGPGLPELAARIG
ncbi:maleylpyruvate isomerase family mycothiol-dependent enzyme [Pseudonocardia sp. RS11V-5]|uniref:maleylpyruvate isomerase family mycothiol-dependent enzyme n=1 Tax=Pseudonocardia terrae TaxID=2905831 RepID=UPI001E46C368|nr:maleylpyruvate isomerase family mycothiol-dependent enzyme [Pseudonocardia terrae]MCE3553224.1 maleylpyruvate isomerase family mycothiol-dependent enzyme [Pseudonocardia terrae]